MSRILHLSNMLKTKEITSLELTRSYLAQIKNIDNKLNSFVSINPELALEQAFNADKLIEKGGDVPLLTGIPMSIKDNIATKGIATTCCSKMLKSYKPTYSATVYSKLLAKNAVLLGKNNMDEFAMGSLTNTGIFGKAHNPYNLKFSPGGSSGGSANAVSSNLAAYSLGSDTAGSARQPASFCGVVSLKPTYGMISRYGLVSLVSSFDQICPITSTVTDCAIVFDSISGNDEKDMMTFKKPSTNTLSNLTGDVNNLKIGVLDYFFDNASPEIVDSITSAIEVYKSLGAKIIKIKLPNIQHALPIYYVLGCSEIFSNFGRYDGIRYGHQTAKGYKDINEMIAKTRTEGFGDDVKRRILLGMYFLESKNYKQYYEKASILRSELISDFEKAFEMCDVIITPTTPTAALPHSSKNANSVVEKYSADICVVPANVCKIPAISLPCGKTTKGLPIGMQLIGPQHSEGRILNAAYAFEREVALNLNPGIISNI